MRDGMRRPIGLALLLGLLCGAPAWAQERAQVQPGSRPWSDPPAKPAEASSAPRRPGPPRSRISPPEPRRRQVSEPDRSIDDEVPEHRQVRNNSKFQNNQVSHRCGPAPPRRIDADRRERGADRPAPQDGRAVTAPRRAEARVAARPGRPVVERLPARIGAVRYVPPPDLREPTDLWIDARADRIRRARDGGYLVMRRTTIEDATGRRMQVLRPLDDEDE